jgi:hypothetical protein
MRDLSFRRLRDGREVVGIVRQELLRNPATTVVEFFGNYSLEGERLPADDRLLPAAREWVHSSDPEARLLGAEVMGAHLVAQDTAVLKAL